ncbi:MAG TPA: FtsW/RodA/SpoVE family cell cycle protein [Candidatus Sulfotelmatobacter sp.]|jgi:rod shape determining protein RodA|nr:FtsW/RodA/SpoVE family cell cycle protein [Candidatus Sulfotelmatobacter sp.]
MKNFLRVDFLLLLPVVVLVSVSLVTLLSLNFDYFKSQFASLFIAIVGFLIFSQVNVDFFRQLKWPIYILSLIFLLVTLAIGIQSHGAVRWIDVFGIRLQFSEILKPFLSLIFASMLAERSTVSFKSFFLALLFVLPIFLLVYFQPDLGSALLFLLVALFALMISGYPFRWFALLFLPFVILMPVIWTKLHDYQRNRILTFLNPQADPLGVSYNSIQALIAVGSGVFFGKGLSEGTQSGLRFLPERQTDFIFATIAEGLGFIGALIIITALLFLCYRIFRIFSTSSDRFIMIFAACAFGFFLIPAFVNIGMNLGIMPIVGVPLPFVSFGGSSLLSNFIFLGLLSAMNSSEKHKNVLEIR